MKMQRLAMAVALAFLFGLAACGGSDGGNPAVPGDVNTPAATAITTALSANNPYGIVPGLVLGTITMPACTSADGTSAETGVTYSMTGLPAWLAFDPATRVLSLANGATAVPADALAASEVTYTCTSDTAAAQTLGKATTASSAFTVNDLDGGGVTDGHEYRFGAVPLAGNGGWFWLTPDDAHLYRGGTNSFFVPTGIDVAAAGMNPADAIDDTADFDGDTLANNAEIASGTNIFATPSNGTFGTATTYPTGNGPGGIATGDLDNDGDLDLALANRDASTISVLINKGDGTFNPKTDYAGARPIDVGIADFDGDGDLDIAGVNFNSAKISIYLNDGAGAFAAAVDYDKAESDGQIALGDFDGDGDVDIAATNGTYSPTTTLSVLLGNGDGTFAARTDYTVGDVPRSLIAADLNGDDRLDIIVGNNEDDTLSVLLGNGDGTFAARTDFNLGISPSQIAAADFDRDGDLDIVVTDSTNDRAIIIPGKGDGTLDTGNMQNYTAAGGPSGVVASDLDGDGDIDLAYCVENGGMGTTVEVRLNDGSGVFGSAVSNTVGLRPTSITSGDFNGDGRLDLANTHFTPNDPAVLLNQ